MPIIDLMYLLSGFVFAISGYTLATRGVRHQQIKLEFVGVVLMLCGFILVFDC